MPNRAGRNAAPRRHSVVSLAPALRQVSRSISRRKKQRRPEGRRDCSELVKTGTPTARPRISLQVHQKLWEIPTAAMS